MPARPGGGRLRKNVWFVLAALSLVGTGFVSAFAVDTSGEQGIAERLAEVGVSAAASGCP